MFTAAGLSFLENARSGRVPWRCYTDDTGFINGKRVVSNNRTWRMFVSYGQRERTRWDGLEVTASSFGTRGIRWTRCYRIKTPARSIRRGYTPYTMTTVRTHNVRAVRCSRWSSPRRVNGFSDGPWSVHAQCRGLPERSRDVSSYRLVRITIVVQGRATRPSARERLSRAGARAAPRFQHDLACARLVVRRSTCRRTVAERTNVATIREDHVAPRIDRKRTCVRRSLFGERYSVSALCRKKE